MTSKISNRNFEDPNFKVASKKSERKSQSKINPDTSKKASDLSVNIFTRNADSKSYQSFGSFNKLDKSSKENELATLNEALSSKEQGAENVLDEKFRSYETLLKGITSNHSKKLVEGEDRSIQIKDRNQNFLNRILRNFLSGRNLNTQKALETILTDVGSKLREDPNYTFTSMDGNERSLQDLLHSFLRTSYAQNVLKHSSKLTRSVVDLEMHLLTKKRNIGSVDINVFRKLNSTYNKLLGKKSLDVGATLKLINRIDKLLIEKQEKL